MPPPITVTPNPDDPGFSHHGRWSGAASDPTGVYGQVGGAIRFGRSADSVREDFRFVVGLPDSRPTLALAEPVVRRRKKAVVPAQREQPKKRPTFAGLSKSEAGGKIPPRGKIRELRE
jgi:hypothetical protein